MGPPLSKKSFPLCRLGGKTASREVGIFLFFPNFFFYKLECTGGTTKDKKKFQLAFLAHFGTGQETTFYLRMAWALGMLSISLNTCSVSISMES